MTKTAGKWIALTLVVALASLVSGGAAVLAAGEKARDIKTINLTVEGMTCGGCVGTVTNALEDLRGVKNVEVSLADKNAVVKYDAGKVEISAMIAAVNKTGKTAKYEILESYLQGVITDGLSGEPIAGAKIRWVFKHYDEDKREYIEDHVFETVSNQLGEYIFAEIPEGKQGTSCTFGISVEAQGYLSPKSFARMSYEMVLEIDSNETMNVGLLAEDKSKIIKGKILNAISGDPIAQATAKAVISNPENDEVVKTLASPSQADGTFLVEIPAAETKGGEYVTIIEVEKKNCAIISYDLLSGGARQPAAENFFNFAVFEFVYHLATDEDLIVFSGAILDGKGEPVKNQKLDFAGVYFTETCATGCCGDFSVYDVKFAEQPKTDSDGKFSFKAPAQYLFGPKYGVKVSFGDTEKTYRAIFEQGDTEKFREVESTDGDVLELHFVLATGD